MNFQIFVSNIGCVECYITAVPNFRGCTARLGAAVKCYRNGSRKLSYLSRYCSNKTKQLVVERVLKYLRLRFQRNISCQGCAPLDQKMSSDSRVKYQHYARFRDLLKPHVLLSDPYAAQCAMVFHIGLLFPQGRMSRAAFSGPSSVRRRLKYVKETLHGCSESFQLMDFFRDTAPDGKLTVTVTYSD